MDDSNRSEEFEDSLEESNEGISVRNEERENPARGIRIEERVHNVKVPLSIYTAYPDSLKDESERYNKLYLTVKSILPPSFQQRYHLDNPEIMKRPVIIAEAFDLFVHKMNAGIETIKMETQQTIIDFFTNLFKDDSSRQLKTIEANHVNLHNELQKAEKHLEDQVEMWKKRNVKIHEEILKKKLVTDFMSKKLQQNVTVWEALKKIDNITEQIVNRYAKYYNEEHDVNELALREYSEMMRRQAIKQDMCTKALLHLDAQEKAIKDVMEMLSTEEGPPSKEKSKEIFDNWCERRASMIKKNEDRIQQYVKTIKKLLYQKAEMKSKEEYYRPKIQELEAKINSLKEKISKEEQGPSSGEDSQ